MRRTIDIVLLMCSMAVAGLGVWLLFARSTRATGATLIAAAVVAVGTYRTIQVTRVGQVTELFKGAIDHLNGSGVVRLGGIYTMERIAREWDPYRGPIAEILTAFVRESAPRTNIRPAPEPDVQAALAVLGRRRRGRHEHALDLKNTGLRKALLPKAQLGNALFVGADLRGADLRKADLRRAHLQHADLREARLDGADLRGAEYDASTTQWPLDFDATARGAIVKKADEDNGGRAVHPN